MTEARRDPFPGYDVLSKRDTPSWNESTRRAIDRRLAIPDEPRFFDAHEFATVTAFADRIVPQPKDRPPIPVAALIDHALHEGSGDGYRYPGMPREGEAWRRGLRAMDAEARRAHGADFTGLPAAAQDALLKAAESGELKAEEWGGMPSKLFFRHRLAQDIVHAYYGHPTSWNEIGFGGPASPRGYVRLGYDMRDPWEAAEVKGGDVAAAARKNARVG